MNALNIYPIGGLFYELYSPNPPIYNCKPLDPMNDNPLYRINALFWATVFSNSNIERLLDKMASSNHDMFGLIENAVLSNRELFKDLTIKAPLGIVNQALSQQEMFSLMEQMQIACQLFSKYLYSPFSLSIQDGFLEPDLSSNVLIESLFDINKNPYIDFISKNVFSILKRMKYKMVWINGQPRLSSLLIAAYIKQLWPDMFIAIRYHSSEYFSLNKIDDLLMDNQPLFSIVDCIVLDDSLATCNKIEEVICSGSGIIDDCPNILYKDHVTNKIMRTKSRKVVYSFAECMNRRIDDKCNAEHYISPATVVNMKLNPNTACFWNKCTFCAINKKYKYINNQEFIGLEQKIEYIEQLVTQGIQYIWFEDEAIPPDILVAFAKLIIKKDLKFKWQVRSRIDNVFSEEIANKLYQAGLREIRFGLESANSRILSLMNKFPAEITLDTVENVVRIFTTAGIHVHFPMIVGFPTETVQERIDTYNYLSMLRNKYKRVTYNINILMLDYASDLYKNFMKYGISSIDFPCPQSEFLGNMLSFNCNEKMENRNSIDYKRNEFMRETLYPWMPKEAHVQPYLFYRLSETIRNTLIWHCECIAVNQQKSRTIGYKKSDQISIWKHGDDYIVYNWKNHRIFRFYDIDYHQFSQIYFLKEKEIFDVEFYYRLFKSELLQPIKG